MVRRTASTHSRYLDSPRIDPKASSPAHVTRPSALSTEPSLLISRTNAVRRGALMHYGSKMPLKYAADVNQWRLHGSSALASKVTAADNETKRILVTGASGFIGSRLVAHLVASGQSVRAMVRSRPSSQQLQQFEGLDGATSLEWVYGDLHELDSLAQACRDVWGVIHCAGHAHAFKETWQATERHNLRTNLEGTRTLLTAAASNGIKRFVFLSSVKAMGFPGRICANESWLAPPDTAYGHAKRAAEQAVLESGASHGFQVTNLRLAMVYGPGGGGNLLRMAKAIASGRFPPLPETGSVRSLIHVDDVVRAVTIALDVPRTDRCTYIVAHPKGLSGAQIYDLLRNALGLPPAKHRCPSILLRFAGWTGDLAGLLMRRSVGIDTGVIARLIDGEHYDPSAFERDTGWQARVEHAEGFTDWVRKIGLIRQEQVSGDREGR